MKKIFLAIAALALVASPVFAQSKSDSSAAPVIKQQQPTTTGQAAQPQPKAAPAIRGPNDVYCGSEYVGTDPDPAVRLQMLRDFKSECN
jgi:hypothetical protein